MSKMTHRVNYNRTLSLLAHFIRQSRRFGNFYLKFFSPAQIVHARNVYAAAHKISAIDAAIPSGRAGSDIFSREQFQSVFHCYE